VHSNNVVVPQVTKAVISPQATTHKKSPLPEPDNHPPVSRRIAGRGAYATLSILDALRDEPKVEDSGKDPELDKNIYSENKTAYPFSPEALLSAWKLFVSTIDSAQLKSALGAREPKISDAWQIEYELDTELQFNRLALDIKPKLQHYLRQHFQNEAIEIQFKVSASSSNSTHVPYTDAERWSLLVEKYPALATLKSKFGLDFEHF